MLPYLVSMIYSRNRISQRRIGFWAFIALLLVSSGAVGFYYIVGGSEEMGSIGVVGLVIGQLFLYRWAARYLLDSFDQ